MNQMVLRRGEGRLRPVYLRRLRGQRQQLQDAGRVQRGLRRAEDGIRRRRRGRRRRRRVPDGAGRGALRGHQAQVLLRPREQDLPQVPGTIFSAVVRCHNGARLLVRGLVKFQCAVA